MANPSFADMALLRGEQSWNIIIGDCTKEVTLFHVINMPVGMEIISIETITGQGIIFCLCFQISSQWQKTVMSICKLTIIVPRSAPSHYLNQCWNIVNLNLSKKVQWNSNQNSYIFIQENVIQNIIWKMAAILSRHQCVEPSLLNWTAFSKPPA